MGMHAAPPSHRLVTKPIFSLREVSKHYEDEVALDNISFDIASRRTTALIGSSGSGKSTILQLLLRLEEPSSGSIRFQSEDLASLSPLSVRRQCGYVIQEGGLFPHLTGRQNVQLLAQELDMEREQISGRTSELAELTHMEQDMLDRYPGELSGGQRQRLGLIRALMLEPAVLLLDEPLGALDPLVRRSLQDELQDIFCRLETSVVLVTHDVAEAAALADEIVLLHRGKIRQQADPQTLLNDPADDFVASFVSAQRGL